MDMKSWGLVVFSNEKWFTRDGPNSLRCYLRELCKKELIFSKRQQGGRVTMVWTAFSLYGKSNLVQIKGRLNLSDYFKVLRDHFLP